MPTLSVLTASCIMKSCKFRVDQTDVSAETKALFSASVFDRTLDSQQSSINQELIE